MAEWDGVERRDKERMARRIGTGILVGMGLVLLLNLYGTFIYNPSERHRQLEAVRAGQVENCKLVGDPLREAVIAIAERDIASVKEEIEQSKHLPPEFFPNIPPDEFDRLQKQGRARDRARIKADEMVIADLADTPACEDRYPPVEELEARLGD